MLLFYKLSINNYFFSNNFQLNHLLTNQLPDNLTTKLPDYPSYPITLLPDQPLTTNQPTNSNNSPDQFFPDQVFD